MRWVPRAELVTQLDIAAAPDQVWALLGQPATYTDWNPFIVSMQGILEEGQVLDNVMQPASRVKALRARGHNILTILETAGDMEGRTHRRVARYVLIALATDDAEVSYGSQSL